MQLWNWCILDIINEKRCEELEKFKRTHYRIQFFPLQ